MTRRDDDLPAKAVHGDPLDVTDSDPGGNTPHGLEGDMGVSSGRVGELREGGGKGTHGAGVPHPGATSPATDQQDPTDEVPGRS